METPLLQQMIAPRAPVKPASRLILCEEQNNWAIAIIRKQRQIQPLLCETRSTGQLWDALEVSPNSLVGIELTVTNFDAVLNTLIRLSSHYPKAVAIILTSRRLQGYEAVLRQAGAIDFLVSTRRLPILLATADRHFKRTPSIPASQIQPIWQRLPWQPRRDTTETRNRPYVGP